MNDRTDELHLTSIEREALLWYWQLQNPDLTTHEWHRWQQWHAVEAHREAFQRVAAHWEQWRRAPWISPHDTNYERERHRGVLRTLLQRLAAILLILISLWSSSVQWRTDVLAADDEARGPVRLNDGSEVTLGAHTRLRIEFGGRFRNVYLAEGTAVFDVAKDSARPFTVQTQLASARALGTRFGVSLIHGEAVVTVAKGTVAVARQHSSQRLDAPRVTPSVVLQTDQQVRVSLTDVGPVSRVDADREMARVTGFVRFSEACLNDVIAEFNRLNGAQLESSDPSAARSGRISGVFRVDQPAFLAQLLADRSSVPIIIREPERPGRAATSQILMPRTKRQLAPEPQP